VGEESLCRLCAGDADAELTCVREHGSSVQKKYVTGVEHGAQRDFGDWCRRSKVCKRSDLVMRVTVTIARRACAIT